MRLIGLIRQKKIIFNKIEVTSHELNQFIRRTRQMDCIKGFKRDEEEKAGTRIIKELNNESIFGYNFLRGLE